MNEIILEHVVETAHRLPSHPGKCRGLHGHSARIRVTIRSAKLNPAGMVVDFGEVKPPIKARLDALLDHATVLQDADPLAELLTGQGDTRVTLLPYEPTAENLAAMIAGQVRDVLDAKDLQPLHVARVEYWETLTSGAAWTP